MGKLGLMSMLHKGEAWSYFYILQERWKVVCLDSTGRSAVIFQYSTGELLDPILYPTGKKLTHMFIFHRGES